MAFLIDADWAIDALSGRRNARSLLASLMGEGVSISWVTLGEICEGAFNSSDPRSHLDVFRDYLAFISVVDLNDDIMERFAAIRAYLRRTGQMIPDFDIVLAATAIHYDLTFLTYDLRHFQRIPGLKLYGSE